MLTMEILQNKVVKSVKRRKTISNLYACNFVSFGCGVERGIKVLFFYIIIVEKF